MPECQFSSKLAPTVVVLKLKRGERKYAHIYSFDTKGTCLCHESNEGGLENHDTDTSLLKHFGPVISEMIGKYSGSVPAYLSADVTYQNLRTNKLRKS